MQLRIIDFEAKNDYNFSGGVKKVIFFASRRGGRAAKHGRDL